MVRPSVFISFAMADRWARDLLVRELRRPGVGLEFVDLSIREELGSSWRESCRERIGRSDGTVVLLGESTHSSGPVRWEIEETLHQGKRMFAVNVPPGGGYGIPDLLAPEEILPWGSLEISRRICSWRPVDLQCNGQDGVHQDGGDRGSPAPKGAAWKPPARVSEESYGMAELVS